MLLRAFKGRFPLTLMRAFCCYVRPILEYASPVCMVKDVRIIENVQRTFTRRVLAKCGIAKMSYEARLLHFGIESLQARRVKSDLVMLYKMSNGLVDLALSQFFPSYNSQRVGTRSNGLSLLHPFKPNLDIVTHSFAFRARIIWNALPVDCVRAKSTSEFAGKVDKYFALHPILIK